MDRPTGRGTRHRAALAAAIVFSLMPLAPHAGRLQTTVARPTFEVASVKPSTSTVAGIMSDFTPGRVLFQRAPVHVLIEFAYSVKPDRIVEAPEWADTARYDVVATFAPGPPGVERVMMQALLEERFSLRVHTETRERPIYALVKARADGQLGPGIKPSTEVCGRPVPGSLPNCRWRATQNLIDAKGTDWAVLNLPLQIGVWDRPIIDRTGLSGRFDVTLEWVPDPAAAADAAASAAAASNGVSIFTALQEQLGLRLESTRGPVEVLVIDAVNRPTAD